jgi:hypothetical protein
VIHQLLTAFDALPAIARPGFGCFWEEIQQLSLQMPWQASCIPVILCDFN